MSAPFPSSDLSSGSPLSSGQQGWSWLLNPLDSEAAPPDCPSPNPGGASTEASTMCRLRQPTHQHRRSPEAAWMDHNPLWGSPSTWWCPERPLIVGTIVTLSGACQRACEAQIHRPARANRSTSCHWQTCNHRLPQCCPELNTSLALRIPTLPP